MLLCWFILCDFVVIAAYILPYAYKTSKKPPLIEFYDLQTDPFEFNNLANEEKYSEEIKKLKFNKIFGIRIFN